MSLKFNKACELDDFADDELIAIMKDVCAHKIPHLGAGFPSGCEYNKDWEVAMAVRTLLRFHALHPDSLILGVAAGVEDTLFYLTRHAKFVFAIDRYFDAAEWSPLAPASMLIAPSTQAPFEFDEQRLVVQHMDGRSLRFPDDTFDGIFSSGSIEHFGGLDDVAASAYEMGRVLKPGGVLSVSTVLRIGGSATGAGFEGTLVMSADDIQRYIIEASGLDPVDDLDVCVSQNTQASTRDLVQVIEKRRADIRSGNGSGPPDYALWDFPHLLLKHDGYLFDSVHLALRKPPHRRVDNQWARPTPAMLESIAQFNDTLLAQHGMLAEKAARPVDQASHPVEPTDESWQSVPVALSSGIRFEVTVDPAMKDPITASYLSGAGSQVNDSLVSLMLDQVVPGDVVLDLGAFVGSFSLAAAAAGCRVLSIEASAHNARLLNNSAVRNGFSELRVVHAAVLDRPEAVEFCSEGPWGRVVTADGGSAPEKVFAVRVDDLIERLGWTQVAFVKMDVEGSEIRAIRGMERLLNGPNPPVVLFESNAHTLRFYGAGPSDLLRNFERFGYDCYLLVEGRLIRTSSGDLQPQTVADYLAVRGAIPSISGWTVEQSMSYEEKIAKLIEESHMEQQDHRVNVALTLEQAGPDILGDAQIVSVLNSLLDDESAAVRKAAGWWKGREAVQRQGGFTG